MKKYSKDEVLSNFIFRIVKPVADRNLVIELAKAYPQLSTCSPDVNIIAYPICDDFLLVVYKGNDITNSRFRCLGAYYRNHKLAVANDYIIIPKALVSNSKYNSIIFNVKSEIYYTTPAEEDATINPKVTVFPKYVTASEVEVIALPATIGTFFFDNVTSEITYSPYIYGKDFSSFAYDRLNQTIILNALDIIEPENTMKYLVVRTIDNTVKFIDKHSCYNKVIHIDEMEGKDPITLKYQFRYKSHRLRTGVIRLNNRNFIYKDGDKFKWVNHGREKYESGRIYQVPDTVEV